ncbi:MAG: galactose mutarotase [Ruminococcaceae bacterium]|jgi:aldose 1-epimerase|nr:galactose mutarotase [Oscillospiraceae bacterium]
MNVFPFGTLSDGTPVTAARLETASGASLTVLDYGATIQSVCVPGRDGRLVDVVLGYDGAAGYESGHDYLGATIGRVGNRIGGARFSLGGKEYTLAKNDGENHLHGGARGFDKRLWTMAVSEDAIVCERLSPDGEEGYPGNLQVRVTFTFSASGALTIAYDAETDADTLVNLTNHCYFNLNGGGSAMGHYLQLFAERFCENDEHCLPTGRLLETALTPFDFRLGKTLGADVGAEHEQLRRGGGYDHNFCLSGRRAAVLQGEKNGIGMTVDTDMPGLQLYTANFLAEQPGKGGVMMGRREAVCLETQLYPNAMNCYGFPSPVLRKGQKLHSETVYSFFTEA